MKNTIWNVSWISWEATILQGNNNSPNTKQILNFNSDKDNLAITKEILDRVTKISKKSFYLSNIIAFLLLLISISFIVYWILLYPTIIFSGNNIVYIFGIPFICWFLIQFLNIYFVNQDLSFEKIKWKIDIENQKETIRIIENWENTVKDITDYLVSNNCYFQNNYADPSREVWFKEGKRVFEFIYRKSYVQIAVKQSKELKESMDEIAQITGSEKSEEWWTAYYFVKIPYYELDVDLIEKIKKVIDKAVDLKK